MRVSKRNDELSVKAYAGVTGVLLAFNVVDEKRDGLLGFAIKRREEGIPPRRSSIGQQPDADGFLWLCGMLPFPGQEHEDGEPIESNVAPIQKFRWSDYSVHSGATYTYRVFAVYGTPSAKHGNPPVLKPLDPNKYVEISVTTGVWSIPELLKIPNKSFALFNRAAGASQAFARKFHRENDEINAALAKKKTAGKNGMPALPDEALQWLSRGVKEGIIDMIAQAKDSNYAVDVAIYQYELEDIVEAVNEAHKRGAHVRLLYHAKKGDKQTKKNEASATKLPKGCKVGRVTSAIFHHKYIVLSRMNGRDREPIAVLAGSTNFTFNGVYCQANDLYLSTDAAVAGKYLDHFEHIFAKETVAETKQRDTNENVLSPSAKLQVGFSPRLNKTDLKCFVALIDSAKQDVLFSTAFNLEDTIEEALCGRPHDSIVRYGVQDKASQITGTHADRTAEFTAAAMLPEGLEGWLHEQHVKGQTGNILIHTKCIVVDFTTDDPIIISGSHNFSTNASASNDENYEIIRGDVDLADNFGCEIMRIYDHYRFRYVQAEAAKKNKKNKKNAKPPQLTPDDSWTDPYFDPKTLKYADRMLFAGTVANHEASAEVLTGRPHERSVQRTRAMAAGAGM